MANAAINERELILDILMESEKGEYVNLLIKGALSKYDYLPEYSKAFIKTVCEGCMERMMTIDYIIDIYSKVKVKKMKPLIRSLMRMSVYQIKFMDNVPSSAVVNEAVKLCKKRHFINLAGFVNGVLRSIDREDVILPDDLSIKYSCPQNIVKLFVDNYGYEKAEKALASSIESQPITIHANTIKNNVLQLEEILSGEGIKTKRHSFAEDALVIMGHVSLGESDAFNQGRFTVQDASSQLACILAQAGEGKMVLDMCAAPGGKSSYVAMELKGKSRVVACDISERKLLLIDDNVKRLGLNNVDIRLADATVYEPEFENAFDVVIADLPCSGLGVMGKKSDLKYRITDDDLLGLKELQRQMLKNAASYVKDGGVLIYSTCTVNPGENVKQISYVEGLGLKRHPFDDILPTNLCESHLNEARDGYIQLLQGSDDCDGFFISRFIKR